MSNDAITPFVTRDEEDRDQPSLLELLKEFFRIAGRMAFLGYPINLTYTIGWAIAVASALLAHMISQMQDQVAFLESITVMPNFYTTIFFTLLSPMLGVIPIIYMYRGEYSEALKHGNQEEVKRLADKIAYTNTIALSMGTAGTLCAAPLYYWSKEVMMFLGQEEQVAEYSSEYLQVMAASAPAIFWRVAMEANLFAARQQLFLGIIDITTFAVATVTAYILCNDIPGLLSLPGISTIAWCYTIESWVTAIINATYMLTHPETRKIGFHRLCCHSKEARAGTLKAVAPQSVAALLNMIMEVFVGFITASTASQISDIQAAALAFSMQLFAFANILTGALSLGGGQVLGEKIGEMTETKNFQSTIRYVFASMFTNLCPITLAAITTLCYPRWAIDVFSSLGAEASNSSTYASVTANMTTADLTTPFINNTDLDAEIEGLNAIYIRIIAVILLLETIRYSLVFSARSSFSPSLALSTCVLWLGIGVGVGVVLASTFEDVTYLLLGWLGGLVATDATLLPLALYLTSQSGMEKVTERRDGGVCYEMKSTLPAALRWLCCRSSQQPPKATTIADLSITATTNNDPDRERSYEMISRGDCLERRSNEL